ncbi:TIGR02680 family protein [Nocardia asteroides]|uniref:TIGR02680 family protein n=1 Tax=Nocardia asteroides TaxID=1824 RepID=UPI001E49F2D0|nr:TIGR02680 family protein [Nocardia asteroides]UGT60872.1 TIGR02680 family protein [Nocardia asteroides]
MNTAPVKHFEERWRLVRAGVVNVWHYLDTEFAISGGRLILRGANGSGKSRALEMLLPFLLDADRRRMDATGSQKVSLDELMRTGRRDQTNRIGYLWLELARPGEHLTLGAHIRYSASAHRSEVLFFVTGKRVGPELPLLDGDREALSRERLRDLIGADTLTDADQHREHVRARVFGLHGEADRDRFTGLIQLLHTLRSPDVGNRIDEGRLPQILSDALPPLNERTLEAAGERLDGLTATRLAQEQLAGTLEQVRRFHAVYRGYAAGVLTESAAALRTAATGLLEARRTRDGFAAARDGFEAAESAAEVEVAELTATKAELKDAITALRERPLFEDLKDLEQYESTVAARRSAAEQGLGTARRSRAAEAAAAQRYTDAAAGLREAAAEAGAALRGAVAALAAIDLPHGRLPGSIGVEAKNEQQTIDAVMDSLDQAPIPITRPRAAVLTLVPGDLAEPRAGAEASGRAAADRRDKADRRMREARRLDDEHRRIRNLEDAAADREHTAADAAARAEDADAARDELAVGMNRGWRDWLDDPGTTRLLPEVDRAHPVLAALLADPEALCGDADDAQLTGLDGLAAELARPVRDGLVRCSAAIAHKVEQHRENTRALRKRQVRLLAADDPEPPTAPWQSIGRGVPLWRAVDFRDETAESERAGIEGALLAAGLLTAYCGTEGALHAEDGEVLLRAGQPAATAPLSLVLRPDPAAPEVTTAVEQILAAVGWQDPDAVTAIAGDGSWRNGILSGRHRPPAARHIGATARAAARRAELLEIERELNEIATAMAELDGEERELRDRRDELDDLIRTAPRSQKLVAARQHARTQTGHATRLRAEAVTARVEATAQRAAWRTAEREHRALCAGFGLPAEIDDLLRSREGCETARAACAALERSCRDAERHSAAADSAYQRLLDSRSQRVEDETTAGTGRDLWQREAVKLEARREALALPLQELNAEIANSEAELQSTRAELGAATARRDEARGEKIQATSDHRLSEVAVRDGVTALRLAAELLAARLRLPGFTAAATDTPLDPIPDPQDAVACAGTADAIIAHLRGHKATTDAQLGNALTRFGAGTTGQLDISQSDGPGVILVHIEGAEHHHDLPAVLTHLTDKVERGRKALTDRERDVFTEFILGNVTDELRSRVLQAGNLVDAMNASLAGTRTSHNIGVRLRWELNDADPELRRLMQLVGKADELRPGNDSEELVALVRERVERLHATDAAAGYAAHLREALDYRAWHAVEVTILGPEQGQTRRISRRAKISQGETRFVSYVTLFAAADGYLSGLPDAAGALRLVLLDDAFAKVDERAIGELMGLLVRLDIDFVMTGHALWGTVPEVPALDIYEIRRIGDSSVVPTHIRWDGRNKSFLTAVGR